MPGKRWRKIIELLEEKKYLSVDELVELLAISPATVRRDLSRMEEEGLIERYRGGARAVGDGLYEESMRVKRFKNIDEKSRIAVYAASLIQDNDIVFLDAGSTTYQAIEHITAKNITVVTTGIPHVLSLSKRNIRTFLLGGFVKHNTEAVTGIHTVNMLETMNFNIALIGANGIHKTMGYTTPEAEEGAVKRLAVQNSGKAYVLADISKINVLCFVSYAALHEATLITDEYGDFDYSLMETIRVRDDLSVEKKFRS